MRRSPSQTRRSIVRAAERLFAERGPEAVSLNEINVAAQQRNTAAVHYHFGSRPGLLDAVLAPHLASIDLRRQALLEALPPSPTLRELVRVLVAPLSEALDDRSGRCFLRIQAWIVPHAPRPLPGAAALMARTAEGVDLPEAVARARGALVQLLLFPALAERARMEERVRGARADRPLFVENLIDAIAGMLDAPLSAETEAALESLPRAAGGAGA